MTIRDSLCTVLDPRGQPTSVVEQVPMAPRLDDLNGKTLYLVDVGFGGGYEFLEEMQGWLSRHLPGARTVLKRKGGNMLLDDPALWTEIKDKGNAVIFGVGG